MRTLILILTLLVGLIANAQDSIGIRQPIHFSLVHWVSTNTAKSGSNNYRFSFNLLTGKVASVSGVEIGGLYNQNTQNMSGLQISGLLNTTKNKVNGIQIAGLSNFSGSVLGVQYAGVINISNDFRGMQTSGVLNIAKKLSGLQISGVYNQVKILRGIQIGIINVADSIDKGGTLGLVNIIKKGGYREWELSTSDYQNIGLSYKTGGKNIYSILTTGYNFSPKPLIICGLGLGSLLSVSDKWKIKPELVWTTYFDKSITNFSNFSNLSSTNVTHLKLGFMRKLNQKIAITFMPSVFMSYKGKNEDNYGYPTSNLKVFSSKISGNTLREIGFGFGIGISSLK